MKTLLVFLLFTTVLLADDSYVGAWSANISPMKKLSKDIQMVKEVVYVKMHQDSSEVFCKFWFYNTGKTQTIKVGFPDYHAMYDVSSTFPIENFKSSINNKYAEVKPFRFVEKIDTINYNNEISFDSAYTNWYVKDVEFKANDTTIIEDYYTGKNGGYAGGGGDNGVYIATSFHYFLGSGKTWKGPIGDGTIIFDHSELLSNYFSDSYSNENKSKKINIIKLDDFTIYNFKDLKPKENTFVDIGLLISQTNEDELTDVSIFDYLCKNKYNSDDVQIMKNELLARLGRPITDNFLKDYFSKKSWYKPSQDNVFKYSKKLLDIYLKNLHDYSAKVKTKSLPKSLPKFRFHPDNEKKFLDLIENVKKEFTINTFR